MNKFLLNIILLILILFLINNKKNKIFIVESISSKNVEEINKNNKKIQKIHADLSVRQGLFSVRGFVAYEKQHNFKMICNSFFRKEMEIGSNENFFWFWARSDNTLYFCEHKNINRTRLRPIFYPNVIKSFLGIDEFFEFEIFENKIIQKLPNNMTKITLIEKDKIIGHELYSQGKLLLESKVVEFEFNLPKKIKINWIEENINQEWILSNIKINDNFEEWKIPNYKNRINLKDY